MSKRNRDNRPPQGRDRHNQPKIPVSIHATPPRPSVPERTEPRTIPAQVAIHDGVEIARRVIFRAPITHPTWPSDMLLAIETAKQLGIRLFEIAVRGKAQRAEPTAAQRITYVSFRDYFGGGAVEGDEWKSAPTISVSGKSAADCVVEVYAVVVE